MPPRATIERRIAKALTGLFVLFALASCGTSRPPAAIEPPPAPAAARVPDIVVEPLPPSRAVAPPVMAPPAPTPKQTAAPPPRPEPEPADDNPKQLFGLSGQRVAALLGPANFVRRDGPAEIWQYRAAECVLDVFLYRRDAALSVAHVDLRQRAKSTEPPRRCFAGLITRQR